MAELLPLGIHFGLHKDFYLADPGIGSTSHKEMVADLTDFQYQRLHGPARADSEALIRGELLHTRVLEGHTEVDKRFAIAPNKADYPNALITMSDLRDKCREIGVKPGTTKAAAIEAIRRFDDDIEIWDEIEGDFIRANGHKMIVKPDLMTWADIAADWMARDAILSKHMRDGVFTGGEPEVSVFFEHNGIRLKARLDFINPVAVIDLKTYAPRIRPMPYKEQVITAICSFRYDLQAVHYRRAWHAAKDFVNSGDVYYHGLTVMNVPALFERDAPKWLWVFVKSIGAPQTVVVEWTEMRAALSWGSAVGESEVTLAHYAKMMKDFGPDADWPVSRPPIILEDADFPVWFGTGAAKEPPPGDEE